MALLFFATQTVVSTLTGTWAGQPPASAAGPVAVQIEQSGDRLQVVKIMAIHDRRSLERVLLDPSAIRSTQAGVEFQVADEIWTIARSGELVITHDKQRFVLKPAVEETLQ